MQPADRINRPPEGISKQSMVAAAVILGAGILAVIMSRTEAILAPLWLLGITAGFTLAMKSEAPSCRKLSLERKPNLEVTSFFYF